MRIIDKVSVFGIAFFMGSYLFMSKGNAQTGVAPLPHGNNGIAALYPSDKNIQSNSDVLFVDGFEGYSSPSQLSTNWNNYYQGSNTRIASEVGNA